MTGINFQLFVQAFKPLAMAMLKGIGILIAFMVVVTVGTIVKVLADSIKLR